MPIAHKDIFCTDGVRTTCGSRMLDNFVAPYDATVVTKLKAAGVVMIGKTNMDEFAMGSSNETSYYGPVRNPWDTTMVPGGSSGGSAAAVGARLVPAATATDTGGSIRQPAALCGVTGLKPTYGRASRYGMIAFASSLDQGGVIAASAEDAALVLGAMAGFDPNDSTSVDRPVPDYAAALNRPMKGLRIGLLKEFFEKGLDAEVEAHPRCARRLSEAGCGAEGSQPAEPAALGSYVLRRRTGGVLVEPRALRWRALRPSLREPEGSSTDLYRRSRGEGLRCRGEAPDHDGHVCCVSAGYYDAYYLQAQKVRQLINRDFERAFADVDVLMGPTTPTPAFALGAKTSDPITMYLNDIYTIGANLAGAAGHVDPVRVRRRAAGRPAGRRAAFR